MNTQTFFVVVYSSTDLLLVFLIHSFSSSDYLPAEGSVNTPSQPTVDSSFSPRATEITYPTPSSLYQSANTPISSYFDSRTPASPHLGTNTPTQSYLDPNAFLESYVSPCLTPPVSKPSLNIVSHGSHHAPQQVHVPGSAHKTVPQQCPGSGQDGYSPKMVPANGFDVGVQSLPGGSPVLGRQFSERVQRSPVLSRQASLGQVPQHSPVLSRQQSLGQPTQGSPVLSRQSSVTHPQGSPLLGRHVSVSQASQRSPSLDRHPLHSGYTTPDERHGNLSRQSSSSGYQGPPTPCFPVSPAGYQDAGALGVGVGFRQGSPAPAFQPQLPEKRRMSSGDRPNEGSSFGTMNGKLMSPVAGGGTHGYFHTFSDFSKFKTSGENLLFVLLILSFLKKQLPLSTTRFFLQI